MTDKQKQRLKDKIAQIKKILAGEKKKFGGYDDSRGIRYAPTELYVKLGDFKGGLRYLRWFQKNFPSDIGFPGFLFESTIILFKTQKLEEAEAFALRTYCSNTYLFNVYFNQPIKNLAQNLDSNVERARLQQLFLYRHDQDDLLEFSAWLNDFLKSQRFLKLKEEFDDISRQLATEPPGPKRSRLVKRYNELI